MHGLEDQSLRALLRVSDLTLSMSRTRPLSMVLKILVENMFKTTLEDVLSIRSVDVSKTFPVNDLENMSTELEVQPWRRHES